ncbi:MAG: hypothetical protein G8345_20550 [Magnetococcales bacterium]|nr:hypothetical protein [Magnetococcales bacterium]
MEEESRQRVLEIWRKLASSERLALIRYGEFLLHQQEAKTPTPVEEPVILPAPPGETAIQAMKRLKKSYAMMETDAGMLDEASQLMTRRIMGAGDAEVIPLIEELFQRRYQLWLQKRQS